MWQCDAMRSILPTPYRQRSATDRWNQGRKKLIEKILIIAFVVGMVGVAVSLFAVVMLAPLLVIHRQHLGRRRGPQHRRNLYTVLEWGSDVDCGDFWHLDSAMRSRLSRISDTHIDAITAMDAKPVNPIHSSGIVAQQCNVSNIIASPQLNYLSTGFNLDRTVAS